MVGIPRGVRRALRLPSSAERLEHELDDEVRFHLDMRVRELVAAGMNEADARAAALARFGDTSDLREYCQSMEVRHMHRMRLREWWDGWLQDVRFAARQVKRSPGFFAVAAITLVLGIASTTAIFSVVRGVLLRPLPYPDADRIVQVWQLDQKGHQNHFADPNYDDLRAQSRSFLALAQVSHVGAVTVVGLDEPVRARNAFVSGDFFAVMGVKPLRGRLFAPEELQVSGPRAVVVSHGFWQQQLGGSESALGQRLMLDGADFTVVGIMPPTLDFPLKVEMWMPREMRPKLPSRTAHNWKVVGRLAPGVTLDAARRDVSTVARRVREQHGEDTWMVDAALVPLHEQLVGRTKGTLTVLMAGSLLLLLIACANVVSLLIARMSARTGEVAVRLALGAGRARLVQQCLAESLILGAVAGAVGVLLARAGVTLLLKLQPANLPRMDEVRVDWQVLVFAVAVSIAAAVAMGIITAWRGTRGNLRDALAHSQRGASASSERVRRVLVVAQVAMAVVLLVGTGLFARSFVRLLSVNPGFRLDRQVVVDVSHSGPQAERPMLYDEIIARFRTIPGIAHVGGVSAMPLGGTGGGNGTFLIMSGADGRMDIEDFERVMRNPERVGEAEFRVAGPGYFEAMSVPLVRGRLFEDRDVAQAPHVALISNSLAKTRWPNEDPIGKVIQFGNMDGDMTPFTIVGVVGDVREQSLATEPRPTFYASYRQRPGYTFAFSFVLSGAADPAAVASAAQRIVRAVRPDLPARVRTIHAIVAGSVADRRFVLWLVAIFGIAALGLGALGVYSVISYLVAQRNRELSIRVALGAKANDIMRLVIRQGIGLAGLGIVIGALAALGATRLIASMLYGVSATDPLAFGAVVVTLTLVATLASWVPARRAARVKAMDVLRVG
ncbi:MAG: ABC transporter permease [Gemmatimonadaceae bacterium]